MYMLHGISFLCVYKIIQCFGGACIDHILGRSFFNVGIDPADFLLSTRSRFFPREFSLSVFSIALAISNAIF